MRRHENLPKVRVHTDKSGVPTVRQCVSKQLMAKSVFIILVLFLLGYCTAQYYAHAATWFHSNYREIVNPVTAMDVVADSELEKSAVAWIRTQQRVTVPEQQAHKIVREVFKQSISRNVDPFIMMGLIAVESGFDYKAVSPKGALGLTQVIPKYHIDKIEHPMQVLDPYGNIQVGTQVLAEYLKWHKGDVNKALRQYNGSLNIPNFGYDTKVLAARASLINHINRSL